MKKIKKLAKKIFLFLGWDFVNIRRSFQVYFYKPRKIFLHPALEEAEKIIRENCPDPNYADYNLHEIGSWGGLPSLIVFLFNSKKNDGKLKSLDIGCAFGTMASFCSRLGFEASAIDFVPLEKYLGEATKNANKIEYRQLSIEKEDLPWEEKTFDLITMTEVLEHFKYQPLTVLKKIRTVMKDGGLLLLSTPALGPHWKEEYYSCPFEEIPIADNEAYEINDRHWKIYSAEELKRLLEKAGFETTVTISLNINTGDEHLYAVAIKK